MSKRRETQVLAVPVANVDGIEAKLKADFGGTGIFTVPLNATGNLNARPTHLACGLSLTTEQLDILVRVLPKSHRRYRTVDEMESGEGMKRKRRKKGR